MQRLGHKIVKFILQIGVKHEDRYGVRMKKAGITITVLWACVFPASFIIPILMANHQELAAWFWISGCVLVLANYAIYALTYRDLRIFLAIHFVMVLLWLFAMTLLLGGLASSGGIFLMGLNVCIGSLFVFTPRTSTMWLGGYLIMLIGLAVLQPFLHPDLILLPVQAQTTLFVGTGLFVGIQLFAGMYYFAAQNLTAYQLVRDERAKSEGLLLNILPAEIAAVLKVEQRTIADQFEGASILFADVVNFTPLSSQMTPVELVELLNEVFSYFDSLVEKYGLEKIKTIGDCYMVASGVPRPRTDHAEVLVKMGLEMQDYIRQNKFLGRQLVFRIGINSGPVVAGVIGRKKFIYDLWGDAVNAASRMESHGAGGSIQITRSTYDLISPIFVCEAKGMIEIKGKGLMEVWHVVSELEAYPIAPPS